MQNNFVFIFVAALATLAGCTSKEVQIAYYEAELKRAEMVLKSQEEARRAREVHRLAVLTRYADAMTNASRSADVTDDIVLALLFAQALQNGQPVGQAPGPVGQTLPPLKPPPSGAEMVQAWAPVLTTGLAWGFGAWGLSEILNNAGHTISGDYYTNSNRFGRDGTATTTQHSYHNAATAGGRATTDNRQEQTEVVAPPVVNP